MSPISRRPSPLSPLLAVALGALLVWFVGRRAGGAARADAPIPESCLEGRGPDGSCPDARPLPGWTGEAPPETVLDASRVCADAGYLCHGLEQRSERRIMRWPTGTATITVRIPRPAGESADLALRLQRAAARGVAVWNGHPFPVRVLLSERPAGEDFALTWASTLGGRELGRVQTVWTRTDGEAALAVREFSLSTRNPWDASRTLDPDQVMLSAVHEMGHALGLPHSDSERDVMYPANTARSQSVRDFRTMEALYRLENGAVIRP